MKSLFKIVVYVSIIFLIIKLYHSNYLVFPSEISYFYLILSIGLLFIGMVLSTLTWKVLLRIYDCNITFSDGVKSVGLTIFTKYIPGKVLMVLGRAEYVSQKYVIDRKICSSISLETQIISIWVAVSFGLTGLLISNGMSFRLSHVILLVWIVATMLIFSPLLKRILEKLIFVVFKSRQVIPHSKTDLIFKALPYFVLNWIFWSIGFSCLCYSIAPSSEHFISIGLGFPLAASIGILSIVAPGGLGVRESVIAYYLSLHGLSIQDITTISIFSRFWFLIGEVFIFIFALMINLIEKPQR